MKTIRILLFSVFFSSLGLSAYAQDVTKYNFCYAYSFETKMFWVSNIVSGVEHDRSDRNKIYMPPTSIGLKLQWRAKLETILEKSDYLKMTIVEPNVWWDYDRIDERRTEVIGKYKQWGFQIYYVKDMRYRQDKYDR